MEVVVNYLLNELNPHFTNEEKVIFNSWLNESIEGVEQDKILLCCIAIDLISNRVNPLEYVAIFRHLFSKPKSSLFTTSELFEITIRENDIHFLANTLDENNPEDENYYVRVCSVETFILFIMPRAQPALKIRDINDEEDIIIELTQRGNLYTNLEYEFTSGSWNKILWLSELNEFQDRLKYCIDFNATEVISALALPFQKESEHFLYFVYPHEFKSSTHPPNAINTRWSLPYYSNNFFICYSNTKDDWGRTRPFDEDNESRMKE